MTWRPVESTDVEAIGWELGADPNSIWDEFLSAPIPGTKGVMGVRFIKPPGSTYLYFDVPAEFFEEFMAAPSKGQFVNYVLRRSGLAYEKVS